ncbi:MAG TPA: D-amino-acid transaminase [Aliidongia sp.]|nr:D-amino-acid transaminase [Aliidongia sp.]
MSRIAYVSGRYCRHADATVHIEDRGYQFSDGVYEVMAVHGGKLLDEQLHLNRLDRSLTELKIVKPVTDRVLRHILRRVVRLNQVANGSVYLQVTRGVAPRNHAFPVVAYPQLVVTAQRAKPVDPKILAQGISIISVPDQRWARRDIKSVSLLANVLGKQAAREAGAYEAWQIDAEGFVTEGTSSNAWIVTADREIVTRAADHRILNGITRLVVLELAAEAGLSFVERPFSLAEAKAAPEAFLTSTTSLILPVTRIDGNKIGEGMPGPVTQRLRERFLAHLANLAETA